MLHAHKLYRTHNANFGKAGKILIAPIVLAILLGAEVMIATMIRYRVQSEAGLQSSV